MVSLGRLILCRVGGVHGARPVRPKDTKSLVWLYVLGFSFRLRRCYRLGTLVWQGTICITFVPCCDEYRVVVPMTCATSLLLVVVLVYFLRSYFSNFTHAKMRAIRCEPIDSVPFHFSFFFSFFFFFFFFFIRISCLFRISFFFFLFSFPFPFYPFLSSLLPFRLSQSFPALCLFLACFPTMAMACNLSSPQKI